MTTSSPEPKETDSAVGQPRSKRRDRPYKQAGLFAYLMLILAVFAVFGSILQSPILWSEYDTVQRSSYESLERWQDAWNLDAIRQENPLSVTSYFLESSIPLDPALAHRLVNLVLHLIAALLLLRILEALKLAGAYLATLIFALHPALTQTLFMWGYRCELIGLIFILLALLYGIRQRHAFDFALTLSFTAIAAILHPSAIAIPIILGLIIFLKNDLVRASTFNMVLPVLCVSVLISAWVNNAAPSTDSTVLLKTTSAWSTHAGQNLFFYLERALGTGTPALFYSYDSSNLQSRSLEASLLPFCILLPFYALAIMQSKKRWSRGLLLGLTSFLTLLFPALFSFGQNFDGQLAHEEHHLYVALPALIALLVTGSKHIVLKLEFVAKGLWYLAISLILLIEIMISGSWSYALGRPAEMWRAQAEQWPDSWRPQVALLEYTLSNESAKTDIHETIKRLEKIIQLNPELYEQRLLLARSYMQAGQKNNALREYRLIVRSDQTDVSVIQEVAELMDQLGFQREARATRKRIEGDINNNPSTETSN